MVSAVTFYLISHVSDCVGTMELNNLVVYFGQKCIPKRVNSTQLYYLFNDRVKNSGFCVFFNLFQVHHTCK